MALIPCPECGKMISNQAINCPACGFPIEQYVRQNNSLLQFGRYPRNGERIEWKVLERVDRRAYLISDKCVDFMFYNDDTQDTISWEGCFLRQWLNTTFLESAFSQEEKQRMLVFEADANSGIEDGVSLLSGAQVEHYFQNESSRAADATNYAKSRLPSDGAQKTSFPWWARSSFITSEIVLPEGKLVRRMDAKFNATPMGVRPVICIMQN